MQGTLAGQRIGRDAAGWRAVFTRGAGMAILLALAWAIATQDLRIVAAASAAVAAAVVLARAPALVWIGIGVVLPFAAARKWGVISALDIALGAAFFLWFVDGVRRRTLTLHWVAPALAGALYVGALLLSTLGARDLEQALAEVVKWSEFVAVLLIAPAVLQRTHVRWVIAGVLVGASLQALLGIYQFVFQIGPEWFIILGRFMRASGTFAQPNPFGGYLGLVLPVALSLTIDAVAAVAQTRHGVEARTRWMACGWLLFVAAAAAIIAAGLLASWSRGGWLGAVAAGTVVIVIRSRRAAFAVAGAALLALALALLGTLSVDVLPQAVTARVQDIPAYFGAGDVLNQEVNDDNFAVIERLAHWEAARRMFELAPLAGVGPGNYAAVYADVNLPRWEEALGHAHNIYWNTLAETGMIGFSAFMLLWGTAAFWCARQVARMKARTTRDGIRDDGTRDTFGVALGVGVLGVLTHLAVHSVVDNLFVQGIYIQIALWLALVAVHGRDSQASAPSAAKTLPEG